MAKTINKYFDKEKVEIYNSEEFPIWMYIASTESKSVKHNGFIIEDGKVVGKEINAKEADKWNIQMK